MLRTTGDVTGALTFAEVAEEITSALCNGWHCRYAEGGIGLSGPEDQLVVYRHPDPTSVPATRLNNLRKLLTLPSKHEQIQAAAALINNEGDAKFVLPVLRAPNSMERRAALAALLAGEALTLAQIGEEGHAAILQAALDQLVLEFGDHEVAEVPA